MRLSCILWLISHSLKGISTPFAHWMSRHLLSLTIFFSTFRIISKNKAKLNVSNVCWLLNRRDEIGRELSSGWTKGGCGRVAWWRFYSQFYSRIIFGLRVLCSRWKGKCFFFKIVALGRILADYAWSRYFRCPVARLLYEAFRFEDSDLRESVKFRSLSILGLLLTVVRTNNIPLTQDEFVANPETNCNSEH